MGTSAPNPDSELAAERRGRRDEVASRARAALRLEPIECRDVRPYLAGLAEDDLHRRRRIRRHVAGCLRCQLELARARRARQALGDLRDRQLNVHPGQVDELLAALDAEPGRNARRRVSGKRLAYAGAIAAASTTVVASLVVGRNLRRPA